MRILINAIPLLSPLSGVSRYTYHLAKALKELAPEHEYFYYYGYVSKSLNLNLSQGRPGLFFQTLKNLLRKTPFFPYLRQLKHRMASVSTPLVSSFDLYLEPNFIPLRGIKARRVLTVIHDFSFHLYPEWHPEDRVAFFRENFWKELPLSDLLITVSETIRKEALELGLPAEKLKVIYSGLDHSLFKPLPVSKLRGFAKALKLPPKFLLFVGTLEPRKNLGTLFEAYELLPERLRREFPLLLAGASGWKNESLFQKLKSLRIRYLGHLPDGTLVGLYNLATLFLYPSLYEGFGFPPLEAMACGCPVLVSDIPVFKEVYGEAPFYYSPPEDPLSLAKVLQNLLENPSLLQEKKALVRKQAQLYNWEKTAKTLLEVLSCL